MFAADALLLALHPRVTSPLATAAGVLFAVNITAAVPITPSNLGVFQAACVGVLAAAGVESGDGLSYGLLLQVVEFASVWCSACRRRRSSSPVPERSCAAPDRHRGHRRSTRSELVAAAAVMPAIGLERTATPHPRRGRPGHAAARTGLRPRPKVCQGAVASAMIAITAAPARVSHVVVPITKAATSPPGAVVRVSGPKVVAGWRPSHRPSRASRGSVVRSLRNGDQQHRCRCHREMKRRQEAGERGDP